MADLLITNGTLCTWQPDAVLINDGALYIQDGVIKETGSSKDFLAKYPAVEHLDANGQLVMPGNICAHTHFYGAFARGMAIPGKPAKDFPEILEKLWWPLDQALDEEAVRYSALVLLIDAIKHGTTTLFDHHASPNALSGSLDVIADAVDKAGLRAVLCYEVTDRYGAQSSKASIEENIRFIKAAKSRPRLSGLVGLHASLTLNPDTLDEVHKAVTDLGVGVHVHVAEHEEDEYDSIHKYGMRVVERLLAHDLLGPKSIIAHAVHVDTAEVELLHKSGTWVTHQPRSNMNNGVGAAEIDSMLRAGVKVCLGNDGFSNNMWADWKSAYLLQKVVHRDPRRANGTDIVRMAIHHNAALAAEFFPETPPGYLKPGAAADIIFVDYHPITPMSAGNLPWHILFGFESSMVTTTICAGEVLMRDRELLTLDEAEITAKSREIAEKTWNRYDDLVSG